MPQMNWTGHTSHPSLAVPHQTVTRLRHLFRWRPTTRTWEATNSRGTIAHHLQTFGDEPSHTNTQGWHWRSKVKNFSKTCNQYSANSRTCIIRSNFGDRRFTAACPRQLHSLPACLNANGHWL